MVGCYAARLSLVGDHSGIERMFYRFGHDGHWRAIPATRERSRWQSNRGAPGCKFAAENSKKQRGRVRGRAGRRGAASELCRPAGLSRLGAASARLAGAPPPTRAPPTSTAGSPSRAPPTGCALAIRSASCPATATRPSISTTGMSASAPTASSSSGRSPPAARSTERGRRRLTRAGQAADDRHSGEEDYAQQRETGAISPAPNPGSINAVAPFSPPYPPPYPAVLHFRRGCASLGRGIPAPKLSREEG
jgi:hypothetical protein